MATLAKFLHVDTSRAIFVTKMETKIITIHFAKTRTR